MPSLKTLVWAFLISIFAFSAFAGEMSAEKVARKTKLSKDESDGILDFKGPDINSIDSDPYYVRSFMNRETGVTVHFIIVEYDFLKSKGAGNSSLVQTAESLFKNFYVAVDGADNEFETKVFHKDFDCSRGNSFCEFEEYFRIVIDDTYFREHAGTGVTLYAKSRAGPAYKVTLYPAYIQGFLQKLDQEKGKRRIN